MPNGQPITEFRDLASLNRSTNCLNIRNENYNHIQNRMRSLTLETIMDGSKAWPSRNPDRARVNTGRKHITSRGTFRIIATQSEWGEDRAVTATTTPSPYPQRWGGCGAPWRARSWVSAEVDCLAVLWLCLWAGSGGQISCRQRPTHTQRDMEMQSRKLGAK